MQISLLLTQEIVKLFAIMLMGYAVVTAGLMKAADSRSVSVILVYLVIPCVIIKAFQVDYTPDIRKGLLLAALAAVAVHILFLAVTVPLKRIFHLDAIEQATCIYSNAGILVIPLVQALLGQDYVIYSSAYIAVQLILLWTHGKNLLCGEKHLEWKRVLLNVNILSILAGISLFFLRIQLPEGVQDVLGMMNNMIGPLGMLLAGMAIAEIPLKIVFTNRRSYLTVVLRLLVYPLLALLLIRVIGGVTSVPDARQILLTVYLASVTPACATVTSMAQLYDRDAAYSSSLYVLTTLLSILSMPVMIYCYECFF